MFKPILDLLDRREAELRELLDADADVEAHKRDRSDVEDFKDAAMADTQAVLDDSVAARAVTELREIAATRARILQGTYGACTACSESIATARLLAVPTASLCTQCQAREEAARPAA